MHHLLAAYAIICGVAICLKESLEVAEELQRALAFAAHAKIENRLQRIASADLECESGVCVISVDSIYQADTLGSRTPTEK